MTCAVQVQSVFTVSQQELDLPSGPYVLAGATGSLHQVSLFQDDLNLAFLHGVVGDTPPSPIFHSLPVGRGIPVSSRLYHTLDSRPLAGLRFAVKDTFAIRGLKRGFGSQAWRDTYPPETTTATCINLLIEAGAELVGVVKSTEFAEGVHSSEWTDSVCPYNPRGDGQQEASSSSAGSAVAAAAYKWLDFSIGTDTGGSIRHPAGVQGLYGQRCSSALAILDGVLGATDLFNTIGVFARDVKTFCQAGSQLINLPPRKISSSKPRVNLLCPTRAAQSQDPAQAYGGQYRWFPNPEADRSTWTEAEKQIDVTIAQLELALKCQRVAFNMNELWAITPPKGQPRSLDEAVGEIYSTVTTSSAVHTRVDAFVSEYAAIHGGSAPQISDLVQRRLDYGRRVSKKQLSTALESMQAFSQWAETTLFGSHDEEATTLLVFPQSFGRPDYRHDLPDRTELFNDGFSIYSFGYLIGCPDYTIPVGEVPFVSKVTGATEYLPVSISLVGRPGKDAELFDVVRQLREAGIFRDVQPGARLYAENCESYKPGMSVVPVVSNY